MYENSDEVGAVHIKNYEYNPKSKTVNIKEITEIKNETIEMIFRVMDINPPLPSSRISGGCTDRDTQRGKCHTVSCDGGPAQECTGYSCLESVKSVLMLGDVQKYAKNT